MAEEFNNTHTHKKIFRIYNMYRYWWQKCSFFSINLFTHRAVRGMIFPIICPNSCGLAAKVFVTCPKAQSPSTIITLWMIFSAWPRENFSLLQNSLYFRDQTKGVHSACCFLYTKIWDEYSWIEVPSFRRALHFWFKNMKKEQAEGLCFRIDQRPASPIERWTALLERINFESVLFCADIFALKSVRWDWICLNQLWYLHV